MLGLKRWFNIEDTFHLCRFLVSVVYLKFLLKCRIQHYLFHMENQTARISLKYWPQVMLHVLDSCTWKITNLNYTILPKQTFFTDTISNGVAGNYCCIWRILTSNRRSFTNLLACFIALTEPESIVVIFFPFTSSNCSNVELSFLFFWNSIRAFITKVIVNSWGIHIGFI